jgi:LmbE family N-acetylglucosaminyl deacetylase
MRVLIVAAHPDDEVLGCGGTIARHVDEGDAVGIVFLVDGVKSRSSAPEELQQRQLAATMAARALGVDSPSFHLLPDNGLDTVPLLEVAKIVEADLERFRPDIVYTHHSGDLNVDHRRVAEAVMIAARPQAATRVNAIYGFEVLSSTEWAFSDAVPFRPRRFVDITRQIERKCAALACYEFELRPFPHPRSREAVLALAATRGAIAGFSAAEAFTIYREIVTYPAE